MRAKASTMPSRACRACSVDPGAGRSEVTVNVRLPTAIGTPLANSSTSAAAVGGAGNFVAGSRNNGTLAVNAPAAFARTSDGSPPIRSPSRSLADAGKG
jgi:hypothetical protein